MASPATGCLNAALPTFKGELDQVSNLIFDRRACTKVSFWGARILEIQEKQILRNSEEMLTQTGPRNLNELTARVIKLSESLIKLELPVETRKLALQVCRQLGKLYAENDKQIANSFFLTKIFASIRDIFSFQMHDREENRAMWQFRTFSHDSYLKTFDKSWYNPNSHEFHPYKYAEEVRESSSEGKIIHVNETAFLHI